MEENIRKKFKVSDDIGAKLEQRFINWFLDTVMLIVLSLILITIVATIAESYKNKTLTLYLLTNPIGQFTFITIIRLLYYISFETLYGRTVGKFVTQTMVVDENGNPATHEVVLIRTLCRLLPFYEFSFLFNPKRLWHDSLSKTYVVNKKELEESKRQFYALK